MSHAGVYNIRDCENYISIMFYCNEKEYFRRCMDDVWRKHMPSLQKMSGTDIFDGRDCLTKPVLITENILKLWSVMKKIFFVFYDYGSHVSTKSIPSTYARFIYEIRNTTFFFCIAPAPGYYWKRNSMQNLPTLGDDRWIDFSLIIFYNNHQLYQRVLHRQMGHPNDNWNIQKVQHPRRQVYWQ